MGNATEAPGDDLEVLDPAERPVPYQGRVIAVAPIGVGVVPRLVRQARPVLEALFALDEGSDLDPVRLLDLIADHGEAVIEAVAIATGQPAAVISKGNPAEFTLLSLTVWEVNRDFFAVMIARLPAQLRRRPAAMPGAGLIASSS